MSERTAILQQDALWQRLLQRESLRKDPYVLAHRYQEYMKGYPRRVFEKSNPYFEKLLANQPDPDPEAKDDRSRAIRYAKRHYECFHEL